jgi:hypothetical protein
MISSLSLLSSHQILIKLHPQAIMTLNTKIDSNLLVLPQEDLNSKSKGNLILLKLPIPINQLQTCRMKILASSHSSALICNDTTTYSLSALGTSNALVLVPPVQQVAVSVPQNGKEQDGDSNSTESPRKKSKPSPLPESRHSIRPSRLVQPGGSGAFFLEATLASVDASLVQKMLQEAPQKLAQLSSKLQFAPCQIQEVLDTMFVCLNDQTLQYQLLDEETILDAKRAVLSVLVEECADHADTGVVRRSKDCVQHVASRLDQMPQASAIARQVLEQLRVANTGPNDNVLHLDATKVRKRKMDGLGISYSIRFPSFVLTHTQHIFTLFVESFISV